MAAAFHSWPPAAVINAVDWSAFHRSRLQRWRERLSLVAIAMSNHLELRAAAFGSMSGSKG